jgi:DNA-binding XRE family transcriptional regulator
MREKQKARPVALGSRAAAKGKTMTATMTADRPPTTAYPTVKIKGTTYHLVSADELRRLTSAAGGRRPEGSPRPGRISDAAPPPPPPPPVPPLPEPDAEGNVPAVAFARANIAREIINRRTALGLSQSELARRAGVRQETLSRLETGKTSPDLRTVEKVERALVRAAATSAGAAAAARRRAS